MACSCPGNHVKPSLAQKKLQGCPTLTPKGFGRRFLSSTPRNGSEVSRQKCRVHFLSELATSDAIYEFEPQFNPAIGIVALIAAFPPVLFWVRVYNNIQRVEREKKEEEKKKEEEEKERIKRVKKLYGED